MTTANPTVPTTVSEALKPLTAELAARVQQWNQSLPAAFQGIAPLYAAGVIRMTYDNSAADVAALYAKLRGLTTPAALDAIHANMTADELVTESAQMTALFQRMAQDSYDAQQLGKKIVEAVLSAGIWLGLKAVGF